MVATVVGVPQDVDPNVEAVETALDAEDFTPLVRAGLGPPVRNILSTITQLNQVTISEPECGNHTIKRSFDVPSIASQRNGRSRLYRDHFCKISSDVLLPIRLACLAARDVNW